MNTTDFISKLQAAGLTGSEPVSASPLTGGVSSDIQLVRIGERRVVVKTALAKLRVKDEWLADISRNSAEQDYFEYTAPIVPDAVPRMLHRDPVGGWFAMEYFGPEFTTWKELLLAGRIRREHADQAGEVLGRVHRASWGDPEAKRRFATTGNFRALRLEPYLLTTAERQPVVRALLTAEAERLAKTQLALVHGDYSPKNLLVGAGRLIVLDAECAWFGDPAFDVAFLLTHLYLKALLLPQHVPALLGLVVEFWASYVMALDSRLAETDLEARAIRLLLCLMLARVHGKSPVEYLRSLAQHEHITAFVLRHLPQPPASLATLTRAWGATLSSP